MTRRFVSAALAAALLSAALVFLVAPPAHGSVPRVILAEDIGATW